MGSLLGLALLLVGSGASEVRLEGQLGVGGGYEGNVTFAPTGQPTPGSAIATAWAGLGVAWEPGDATSLSAGGRYDGALLPGATDLDRNTVAVDLLLFQEIGDTFALIAGGSGNWSWYRDEARSGPGLLLRATLRARVLQWLTLRGGYVYTQRWADLDVYSTFAHRLHAGVEARVIRGVYLGVSYAWQTGEQTFYESVSVPADGIASAERDPAATPGLPGAAAGPGSGSGPGGAGGGSQGGSPQASGVFQNLVPYRAWTTDSTLLGTLDATVWEGLYLYASYSYTWGSSLEGPYTSQSAIGGVGYRF